MHKHITIGLFETFKISRQALARSLQDLLEQYNLAKNIITYVQNEAANLNTMIVTLRS